VRIDNFEQLTTVGGGRQFTVLKAHQCKAPKRYGEWLISKILVKNKS